MRKLRTESETPAGGVPGNKRVDGRKALGALGEKQAAAHLLGLGYKLLEVNWRCRTGEIDIVAQDGDTLVFVEVRTRGRSDSFGTPLESIDFRKRKQVRDTALVYLHSRRHASGGIRFDVIGVRTAAGLNEAEIEHVRNAF
ncbi:YraN family protein [Paenibacillus sp. MBLB4367]|uniref:YraN family protein n=1 Tax=Paenibacillus sp. MBLB4367 TaxID=3384767 RepID=UPI0039082E96